MVTTKGNIIYVGASSGSDSFVPASLVMREVSDAVTLGEVKVASWGDDNDVPQKIMAYAEESEVVEQNLDFNYKVLYGRGVKAMQRQDGKLVPCEDTAVKDFWKENDIPVYFQEQCVDVVWFNSAYAEFLLNESGKVTDLYSKDASFSRLSQMVKGVIEQHLYSSRWGTEDEVTVENTDYTPVLNHRRPYKDLKEKIEKNAKQLRYVLPIRMATPGLTYYPRIPWTAIFRSGWYDLARLIPQYKKALIENQLGARYVIYLSDDYFERIFANERINPSDEEAKEARRTKEYDDIENFLTGHENAGKGLFAGKKSFGKDEHRTVEIVPLKMAMEGGEYLKDIEGVHNIISYGMGFQTSVPGDKSNFSGTEQRELFQMKQALCKPLRDRLLKPFYIVKDINGWPDEVEFVVEDTIFTTTDESSSGQKVAVNE